LQRRVVFGLDRAGIIGIAVAATRLARELCETVPGTEVRLEYSPESFTGTELDFAKEICESVMDAWGASLKRPVILNLPATVEMATPNVYADQVEWISRNIRDRSSVILSVHPHNDRGTAVAAAELAVMAGADRVEGTLFGNGERTGNVDVVTLSLNLLTQGVDPQLEIRDINAIVRTAEYCNRLPVGPRHPYAGELVFTAFSGSHQDAIRKGLAVQRESAATLWEVPYLPMDPADIGRSYEAVIRINSQSGKSGIGYVLETEYGYHAPKRLLINFSQVVQRLTEEREAELAPADIFAAFEHEYVAVHGAFERAGSYETKTTASGGVRLRASVIQDASSFIVQGEGNGVLDAFVAGLKSALGVDVRITDYSEHALSSGTDAQAVAYIELTGTDGRPCFGVGRHTNITAASLDAVVCALNRMLRQGIPVRLASSASA
jgi:2-isopropylmalate synthase